MSMPRLPEKVVVCEVGPRDGLQNEKVMLTVDQKVELIKDVIDAGVKSIEVGSFVHPKAVPSMADTDEVVRRLPKVEGVEYRGLVLNFKGVERACAAGVTKVKVTVSASPTHSRQNSNASPQEVIANFKKWAEYCRERGIDVSGAIATAFGYHAEGVISLDLIYPIVDAYLEAGINEISMSDSTGMANPEQVFSYMTELKKRYENVIWTLHPHNTRGMGMANIYAALLAGVTHIDASFAGLGGCPFIKGASGNVATEDLLNMLHSMGVDTGIDLEKMLDVARKVEKFVGHSGESAMLRECCKCAE